MHKRKIIITALVISILYGCAVMNFYKKLDSFIMAGEYKAADGVVESEKQQYKGEHELLYYFDKGAILQMLGDYKASNTYLDNAEKKIDSLFTKSVTKELSSFFSNDLNLPYEGEDFEKVMVHILKALNFMYMGDFSSALVEARKVNNLMNVLSDRYEGKNTYKEDAFARYLSGFAYEAKGEINDAYIDYKKSYKAYEEYKKLFGTEPPPNLKQDILRTAEALKFYDDIEEYKKKWGDVSFTKYDDLKKKSEILIVIYDGMAPYKISKMSSVTVYENEAEKKNPAVISVAFPYFIERGYALDSAEIKNQYVSYSSYVYEDVAKIAVKTLEEKNGLIAAKTIARAAVKYFAGAKIREAAGNNLLVNVLTNVYNTASEQADTRSWRTLPARFHLIRMPLEPGKQNLILNLISQNGQRIEQELNLVLKPGQKKVIPIFKFN
jgi:hypothetical protein